MKLLKLCWLPVLLMAMFLFGCSSEKVPSNEGEERKAKRFEALKGLPLDTVLSRAFAFYEQYQATKDTLLRDSMDDYRNHFFARWKLSTDSICATVPADDSLAADLRDIYEVVLEFEAKRKYRDILDREKREMQRKEASERNDSMPNRGTMDWMKNLMQVMDDSVKSKELFKRVYEGLDPDTIRALRNRQDSAERAEINGILFEDALAGVKKDSNNVFSHAYFVQTLKVLYVDTVATDMKTWHKIIPFGIERSEMKEAKSACMEKTPIGQQVLVLNKEYESLLNNFMKTKAREDRRFLLREIPVLPHFEDDDFSFYSLPTILTAVFNKNHDMVSLNVNDGIDSGSFYYLSKRSGKWEVVKRRDGWVL